MKHRITTITYFDIQLTPEQEKILHTPSADRTEEQYNEIIKAIQEQHPCNLFPDTKEAEIEGAPYLCAVDAYDDNGKQLETLMEW
jgi:hypothetical protein